jgi:hypothetical protein
VKTNGGRENLQGLGRKFLSTIESAAACRKFHGTQPLPVKAGAFCVVDETGGSL